MNFSALKEIMLILTALAISGCIGKKHIQNSDPQAAVIKSVAATENKESHAQPEFGPTSKMAPPNSNCEVPFATAGWKKAYCMTLHEADETNDPRVQKCIGDAEKNAPHSPEVCAQNHYWKNLWCLVSKQKGYVLDQEKCLKDKSLFPTVVESLGSEESQ